MEAARSRRKCAGFNLLFFQLLDEIQDVEVLNLAVREKAIDSTLLIVENFEDGGELGHNQQLDAAAAQVQQLDFAAGPLHGRVGHHQSAESGAIDVIDLLHIENNIA